MAKLKFEFEGLDNYLEMLSKMEKSEGYVKRAVYDGASVMGQAILDEIQSLKTGKGESISSEQKQGLLDGFGYTRMKTENGRTYTKIGFDGYNSKGQPNALIANIVNSGTSHSPQQKTRFVDKAINSAKNQVYQAMSDRLDEDLSQTVKEYE